MDFVVLQMNEKTVITLGNVKPNTQAIPKCKYRIIIQERVAKNTKVDKMRSFTIYDYIGTSTIDGIKNKLIKRIKNG